MNQPPPFAVQRIEPFDAAALTAHLDRHGVAGDRRVADNFGAEGAGPSIYLIDPGGNEIELKGAPP